MAGGSAHRPSSASLSGRRRGLPVSNPTTPGLRPSEYLNPDQEIPILTLALAALVAATTQGGDSLRSAHDSLPPAAHAARLESGIQVDGRLDDPAWDAAPPIDGFLQRQPDEGAPATLPTEVRVLYDDAAIYVGARMSDTAPDSIIAQLARRDNEVVSDLFVVFIDSYHDRRTGFYFGVNAAGTQYDGTLYNDDWDDRTWDGVWESKARRDSLGWTVEMRIPYSQLRFHNEDEHIWGINFRRDIARRNERAYLVYQPRNESGFVSRFRDLVGISQVRPPRRVEITPYVTGKAEFLDAPSGDPFNDGSRTSGAIGADLKLGLGSSLTLDATANPDFGQVEVDPAIVNLSDVETFYPEKRPFFIEGEQIFSFGRNGANNYWNFNWPGPSFFYSRRIGRSPQGELPASDYADVPEGTTILGAAKVSGKVGSDWNVGGLSSITARETARLETSGQRSEAVVEPLTSYNVLRVRREGGGGRQSIGLIGTGTFRSLDGTGLDTQLNRRALTGGVDGYTWLDRTGLWVLTGWAGMTRVDGTAEQITSIQQNSTHYFQRPDARRVSVDSEATSLSGWAGRLWLNKQRGDWLVNAGLGAIEPGFETNDLGFLSRTDVINGHGVLTRRWTRPGRIFRTARASTGSYLAYNFDGDKTGQGFFGSFFTQFLSYHGIGGFVAYNPQRIDVRGTRGGPRMLAPAGYEAELEYESDDRKPISLFGILVHGKYQQGSDDYSRVGLHVQWRPASTVSVSLGPEYQWNTTGAQYVDAYDDPLARDTYGRRYVFATLDQKEVSANIRLNWTFTPKLSLELFAQPLISSGNYRGYKELAYPKTYDFLKYGTGASTITPVTDSKGAVTGYTADPDGAGPAAALDLPNPDFTFASLRGNAVLRWEYLPGSTLYFVWTTNRADETANGDFDLGGSLKRLGQGPGEHAFALKISYWWHP